MNYEYTSKAREIKSNIYTKATKAMKYMKKETKRFVNREDIDESEITTEDSLDFN